MRPLATFLDQWAQISPLLDEALSLHHSEHAAWLDRLAGERAIHRDSLRTLLARRAQVETDDFLACLPSLRDDPASFPADALAPGDRVGAYRVIAEVGRGGMGTVWLAELADGSMRRRVALKLPRLVWGDTLAVRFAHERAILSSLEHEHIARLYEAGVDAHGRPFLAMEHVDGEPIDTYCRRHATPIAARIGLLLQAIAAVAHAHARLVVHRDLKPANILVTRDERVRLLDFGVAKLLEGDRTIKSAMTELSGRALTVAYASPEQIRGEPLGTASDIYSLAVVAYELLTGVRPYQLKRDSAAQLEEAIASVEPPLASVVAADPQHAQALRGDLDAILNKALKKAPEDRYPSMEALAQDLRRHLDGLPVRARPDSLGYRAAKYVRRHRVQVSAGAAVAVALVAGTAISLWQAREARLQAQEARVQQRHAQEEATTARAVQAFLENVFRANSGDQIDPAKGRQTTALELLDHGAERIDEELAGAPSARLRLLDLLASMYQDLDLYDREIALRRKRLALAEQMSGPTSNDAIISKADLANALLIGSQRDEAAVLLREGATILDALHDETSQARFRIAVVQAGMDRRVHPALAMASAERALVIARRRPPDQDLLQALHVLGDAALFDKSFERARGAYLDYIAVATTNAPLGANDLSLIYEFLGHAERGLGHDAAADESFQKGVEAEIRRNANPLRLSEARTHYAIFLNSVGRFRESLEAVEPAWRWGLTAPSGLPQLPWTRVWYARALAAYGRPQDALAITDGREVAVESGMAEQAWIDRAVALIDVRRLSDARAALDRARDVARILARPPSPSLGVIERRWLVASGRAAEALAALNAARAAKKLPAMPAVGEAIADQVEAAWLRLEAGDPAAATAAAAQALDVIARGGLADYQRDHEARATLVLGKAMLAQDRARDALPVLDRAAAQYRALYAPLAPALADALRAQAEAHAEAARHPVEDAAANAKANPKAKAAIGLEDATRSRAGPRGDPRMTGEVHATTPVPPATRGVQAPSARIHPVRSPAHRDARDGRELGA